MCSPGPGRSAGTSTSSANNFFRYYTTNASVRSTSSSIGVPASLACALGERSARELGFHTAAARRYRKAAAPDAPVVGMEGFVHRYAHVNETEIHYVVGGSGPAVVLLHGWPYTWLNGGKLCHRLQDQASRSSHPIFVVRRFRPNRVGLYEDQRGGRRAADRAVAWLQNDSSGRDRHWGDGGVCLCVAAP